MMIWRLWPIWSADAYSSSSLICVDEIEYFNLGFEDAKQVVSALKDKGISTIEAAGFCWGAKMVTELAKSDNIQAAMLLHPSLVKVDDMKEVKAPIAILAAEIDKISPPELIKQFEDILSSKFEVDKFV
ncbi:hypothetical protein BC332_25779 [Capsicum chinense]|nr:hypothetical protein BC332_25779 [Capsicum chinense]